MKPIFNHCIKVLLLAGLLSCHKEDQPQIQTTAASPIYHISFYDHNNGEKLTGLETDLYITDYENDFTKPGISLASDVNGDISFEPGLFEPGLSNLSPYKKIILKTTNQPYVDALYEINQLTDLTKQPTHTMQGSNGANVVNARLLRKAENDYYFRADLYRKAKVNIHIVQVNDYSDALSLKFNANVFGSDPMNSANYFGINDILGEGVQLTPGKKIDTTISVFAFGEYLNIITWSVYGNGWQDIGLENYLFRKILKEVSLKEEIYPSGNPTNITTTF